ISPLFEADAYPQDNEAAEAELRTGLLALTGMNFSEAAQQVQKLEQAHAIRRDWVWAQLGQSPLALALAHLADLSSKAATSLVGSQGCTPADLIDGYVKDGWRVDAAVLQALEAVQSQADQLAVQTAIRALYADWLRNCGLLMQGLVKTQIP